MEVESSGWSGDGAFTERLLEFLKTRPEVALLRVEDAPSSRAEAGYNFLSNEIYVGFVVEERSERVRRFGFLPGVRRWSEARLSLEGLAALLSEAEGIGPPDYADDGMLQYLRTERIVPPYQTRGVKLVEMVRLYPALPPPRG